MLALSTEVVMLLWAFGNIRCLSHGLLRFFFSFTSGFLRLLLTLSRRLLLLFLFVAWVSFAVLVHLRIHFAFLRLSHRLMTCLWGIWSLSRWRLLSSIIRIWPILGRSRFLLRLLCTTLLLHRSLLANIRHLKRRRLLHATLRGVGILQLLLLFLLQLLFLQFLLFLFG